MCGYVIFSKKPKDQELRFLLNRQRHRGEDGFGAIHLPTGRYVKALKLKDFLRKFRGMPKDGSYLVHHRKASVGGITEDLVHPQKCRDKVGSVTFLVTQNGTKKDLASVFGTKSDTEAICRVFPMLEQHGDEELVDQFLMGAGLVFIYKHHEKRPNELLMWHDGERSLFYCKEGSLAGLYSSEPLDKGVWVEVLPLDTTHPMPLDVSKWMKLFEKKEVLGTETEYVMNEAYSEEDRETVVHYYGGVKYAYRAKKPSPCRKKHMTQPRKKAGVASCGGFLDDGTSRPVGTSPTGLSSFDEDVDKLVPYWEEFFFGKVTSSSK